MHWYFGQKWVSNFVATFWAGPWLVQWVRSMKKSRKVCRWITWPTELWPRPHLILLMKWRADCKQGVVTHHQWLNSLQPSSKIWLDVFLKIGGHHRTTLMIMVLKWDGQQSHVSLVFGHEVWSFVWASLKSKAYEAYFLSTLNCLLALYCGYSIICCFFYCGLLSHSSQGVKHQEEV